MADNTVSIRTQFEGKDDLKQYRQDMKDLRDTVRLIELDYKKGNSTQQEALGRIRDLEKAASKLGYAELDLAAINQTLWHAQNRVSLGFKSLATEVVNLNDKLPPATQQLRQFYHEQRVQDRTLRETSQAAAGFASIFGGGGSFTTALQGAIGGMQQSEFGITAMGIAASRAGGDIGAMGLKLIAIATPISVAIAAGAGLLTWLKDVSTRTKAAAVELSAIQYRLGEISAAERNLALERNRIEKEGEVQAARAGGLLTRALRGTPLGFALAPLISKGDLAAFKEAQVEAAKAREENKKFDEEEAKRNKVKDVDEKKLIENLKMEGRELVFINEQQEKRFRGLEKLREFLQQDADTRRQLVREQQAAFLEGELTGSEFLKPRKVQGALSTKEALGLTKASEQLNEFERSAEFSFAQVRHTIGQSIGQGFVEAFGIGHTLLGQFIQSFISQMTSLASMGLIKGLFSILSGGGFADAFLSVFKMASGGWVNEPIAGIGKSGRAYLLGEQGPEYVSPVSRMNQLGMASRGGQAQNVVVRVVGEFRNRGTEMIATINRSQRIVDGLVY